MQAVAVPDLEILAVEVDLPRLVLSRQGFKWHPAKRPSSAARLTPFQLGAFRGLAPYSALLGNFLRGTAE